MENISEEWIRSAIRDAYQNHQQQLGRFNLAIFGKTGVGKSTLINAIFGDRIAETGIGEPVTRGHHLYKHSSEALGIFDTEGLELGKDDDVLLAELSHLIDELREKPVDEQIHVAWFCVRSRDGRFEDFEAEFVRKLHALRLPVILVLTQVPTREGEVHPRVAELANRIQERGLPVIGQRCFPTMAESDPFDGPTHGLQEVLDATFRAAPEAVKEALTHAQQIDFERKRAACNPYITAAAGTAVAAGASPIPFSDAAILVPAQLAMLAKIAMVYKIPVDRMTVMALAMTAASTSAGRSLVTNLVKFIPGGGTLVGGTISAGVASALTLAMGHAWVEICSRMARGQLSQDLLMDSGALREVFLAEFKNQARKRVPGIRK